MHIVQLMDGVDGQYHFTNVESCHIFRKLVFKFTEQGQQITTHIVVHDQVLQIGVRWGRREYSQHQA